MQSLKMLTAANLMFCFKSFLKARSNLCRLLITFANSLNVWIQTFWHSESVPERVFFKKVDFEKKSADETKSKLELFYNEKKQENRFLPLLGIPPPPPHTHTKLHLVMLQGEKFEKYTCKSYGSLCMTHCLNVLYKCMKFR